MGSTITKVIILNLATTAVANNLRRETSSSCNWNYQFLTNDDPQGPYYDFRDIAGYDGASLGSCTDCNFQVDLDGLAFPFYCKDQTHFSFGSNGGLQTPSDSYLTMQNSNLTTNDIGSDGGIFIMWFNKLHAHGLYYKGFTSCPHILYGDIGCHIFQWHSKIGVDGSYDMQALLFNNGSILFQYPRQVPGSGTRTTIGIQEYNQQSSLLYSNYTGSITDELAVLFFFDEPSSSSLPCETDTEAPVANCKNYARAMDPSGTLSIAASDINDGSLDNCGVASLNVSPSTFTTDNIGENEVTLTVTDNSGNTDTCTSTVTIFDDSNEEMCGFNYHKHLIGLGTFYTQDDHSNCYKVEFGRYIHQGQLGTGENEICDATVDYNYFVGALDWSESEASNNFEYRHGVHTDCENNQQRTATITVHENGNVSAPILIVNEPFPCKYTFDLTLRDCDRPSISMVKDMSVDEDEVLNILIVADDEESTKNVSISITKAPNKGVVQVSDGKSLKYTPNTNYNGQDSFVYMVCDNNNICESANMTITVSPVNDPPVAVDDTASVRKNNVVYIPILENDYDIEGDELAVSITQYPAHGKGNVVVAYTPDNNYTGVDSLEYTVCDPDGGCDTATVNITVN